MRLIDADKFIERCKEIIAEESKYEAGPASWARAVDYEDVIDEINEQPTIDAVPVVRCKDCKWFACYAEIKGREAGCCTKLKPAGDGSFICWNDWYCADGERKDGQTL